MRGDNSHMHAVHGQLEAALHYIMLYRYAICLKSMLRV